MSLFDLIVRVCKQGEHVVQNSYEGKCVQRSMVLDGISSMIVW